MFWLLTPGLPTAWDTRGYSRSALFEDEIRKCITEINFLINRKKKGEFMRYLGKLFVFMVLSIFALVANGDDKTNQVSAEVLSYRTKLIRAAFPFDKGYSRYCNMF